MASLLPALIRTSGDVSIPIMASDTNPAMVFIQLMGFVAGDESDPDELNQQPWFDPLDQRILSMLQNVTRFEEATYKGEPITTVASKYYGTSSAFYVILMYNGYNHPDEIRIGTTLRIPDLSSIKPGVITSRSVKGEIVVI